MSTKVTVTHGSNNECPQVLTGIWKHCQGHTVQEDDYIFSLSISDRLDRIIALLEKIAKEGIVVRKS